MPRYTFVFLAALAALSSACSAESGDSVLVPKATVRDSAGVTIVENAPLDEIGALPWSLNETPVLQIGKMDGEEAYQLFRVRDAHRLTDGRIVLADGGSQEIRVFAPDGRHLVSWGGEGEGPGEFKGLGQVDMWQGDSLIAWDGRLRRLSLFAEDGSLGRMLTLQAREGLTSFRDVRVLSGGSLVVTGISFQFDGAPPQGLFRPPVSAVSVDENGETLVSFGSHPGSEGFLSVSERSIQVIRLLFQRTNRSTAWGDLFVIAGTDSYSLPAYDVTGAMRRIVRITGSPPTITQADIDAEIDFAVAEAPEERQASLRAGFESVPFPEAFPTFGVAIDDAEGNLWVQDFRRASQTGPEWWTVFGSDGHAIGRFQTPEGLRIYEIGTDYILGRTTDEFDVERVVVLGLEKG